MTRRTPHVSRGTTIAECLVAVTLLAVGLLALSTTAVAVQRLANSATLRAQAAAMGVARLESLRGVACVARAGGARVVRGIAEQWRVMPGAGFTLAADSLRLPEGRGAPPAVVAIESALPC
jgi:hypothetical protein